MRLTPGTRVGPYEVVALLGAGGMAEVYRAKDTRLGREVAVKVVSEALGGDGDFLERFDREAKLAASLAHPNVVALHDIGFHDGKPYFVTELLQGESLRERLAKGPIPLGKALEWAAQMAQGLAAAHARGIVHRDLKPENVFITRDGHVKLLDFGIAKLIETAQAATPHGLMDATVSPSGGSTGTGIVLGTPGYMSPEQVRGDPIDTRTDFFSLGTVLYEILSGHRAFPAGPVVESGYAILHNEPQPLPATLAAQVAQVVHRCLEKDPGRRFQSAPDLAFNLELLRSPTGAAPTASPPRVAARNQRWRRWFGALTGILAALGAAGTTYFVMRAARLPALSVEPVTARSGRISAGRFTPEGRVVFSAAWDGEPLELFSRAPGSTDAQSLGLRDAALFSVSPAGELAVSLRPAWFFGEEIGTLALMPGAGGAPREIAENIAHADWSSTGELAVVRVLSAKRQLELPLGTPIFETSAEIHCLRVSPLGDLVAFVNSPRDGPEQLLVVDRRGRSRALWTMSSSSFGVLGQDAACGLAWAKNGEEVWLTTDNAIWGITLTGTSRLIYQSVYPIQLEDISSSGAVLVNAHDTRRELVFVASGDQRERRLSSQAYTRLAALSDDGGQVLSASLSREISTYIRRTDGSPPLKLGPGLALALSPDGKWVLSNPDDGLALYPVGPGVPQKLPVGDLVVNSAQWLRDGKHIVLTGNQPSDGKQYRLYLVPLTGGAPAPISDVVSPYFVKVSRDDRLVAAVSLDDIVTLYPVKGGAPIPLTELGTGQVPAGWSDEGELWVGSWAAVPRKILRYNVRTRRVLEERSVAPNDSTGVMRILQVRITPDSRAMAFDYWRSLSRLYLLDGLAPARR